MALCIELVHNIDGAESSRFTTDLGQHPPSDYVAGRDLPLTVAPFGKRSPSDAWQCALRLPDFFGQTPHQPNVLHGATVEV